MKGRQDRNSRQGLKQKQGGMLLTVLLLPHGLLIPVCYTVRDHLPGLAQPRAGYTLSHIILALLVQKPHRHAHLVEGPIPR